ncbi:MAG: helix-turn-helix domain-containing protein [Phaeovulum sp.]|uniref:TetR/AcrR family transcriptional regulator n=1 Tax=Phaeovulum sp. TaxID=2934796 RepID=UPI0027302CF8|nr:TetR/AcrR family transcriptional regulator [Phaeovulum sp.]MDP2062946.1 helix-turn-helix domain-containing protein [Phaeovulum sp.]
MTESVKTPKRGYRSVRRSAQASDTRAAVLSAAHDLFIRQGWQKATIAAVARQAGVSVETIYVGFGTKRALLEAVVAAAIRGLQPGTPLMDQAGPRAVLEAPDRRSQIARFAKDIAEVLRPVAPLMAVVRAAAESEAALEELYVGLHRGRTRNLAMLVDAMLRHGPLRTDRDTAIASLARLASPELFLVVTNVEGLSPAQYTTWLSDALMALLLP